MLSAPPDRLSRLWRLLSGGVFLSLWLCCATETALSQSHTRPRLFLILCDALSIEDLQDARANPHLAALATEGAIGLMNCGSGGEKSALAAYLTLALGRHFAKPPVLHGDDFAALNKKETRGLWLGAALSQSVPPIKALLLGDGDTSALQKAAVPLVMNASGVANRRATALRSEPKSPLGKIDDPALLAQQAQNADADFVAIQLGDMARAEAMRPQNPKDYPLWRSDALRRLNILLHLLHGSLKAQNSDANILLVSPYPAERSASPVGFWIRLTPAIAWGKQFPAGLLTSATTRTPGVIANVDVAPTLLALCDAPVPAGQIGRPFQVTGLETLPTDRLESLLRRDFVATQNLQGQFLIAPPLFGFCAAWVLLALWARRKAPRLAVPLSAGILFALCAPLGTLLASLWIPPTLWEYGLRIAFWMLGGMAVSLALGRLFRASPLLWAGVLNLATILADTITGQSLIKESLLTNYALSGVRYYGVGNEHLGIVMGFALAGGFLWLGERSIEDASSPKMRVPRLLLLFGWAVLALLLGTPSLGANAGSLIISGAGFGVAIAILYGKRPTWRMAAAGMASGFFLTLLVSALDARFAKRDASHFGNVLRSASGGRGYGYLLEISMRKIMLNLNTLFSLGYLAAALGVIATLWLAWRLQREALRRLFQQRPWLERSLPAALSALVASLLFKDTGAVTALFFLGVMSLLFLGTALRLPNEEF